jgi:hypothetical protein
MIHGAELRVHFLKSFQKESICENLSQKGLKIKKVGRRHRLDALQLDLGFGRRRKAERNRFWFWWRSIGRSREAKGYFCLSSVGLCFI